ncbi:MAG TPA: hypothetical protein VFA07_04615 [Chthonomonadaceae bacterium]|nr:hypothetical protein [Chthonomonadaceae bacterium]
MRLYRVMAVALCLLAGSQVLLMAQNAPFIEIHTGKHWVWVARQDQFQAHQADIEALYDYADRAFDELVRDWGVRPPQDRYSLLVYEQTGGGFAAGDIDEVHKLTGKESPGIGVSYDAFYGTAYGIKAYWAHAIMTHEMVNLFTGQVVSGGWPVDWWADHRSPFPLMTAVQIEYKLVPDVAVHHIQEGLHDPLVGMFLNLKDQYGWNLFRTAFRTAIQDGIHWDAIGENPSPLRTNYVAAYLQIGAPEDIAPILTGLVPGFDPAVVKDILRARHVWTSLPATNPHRAALHAAYLKGDYTACLK